MQDLAAVFGDAREHTFEVVGGDRDVGEPGLVHDALAPLGLRTGRGELHQLEHEAVAHEVDGRHPHRRRHAQHRAGEVVGHLELPPEREAEQLLVEPAGAREVGDDVADVVEDELWLRAPSALGGERAGAERRERLRVAVR